MSKLIAGGSYTIIGEDRVWPSLDQGDLEWRLRYTDPYQIVSDRMLVASIVEAYKQLIEMPQKQRNVVCKALKQASKTTGEDE